VYLNKKTLAIIPARGGSKGLPGKNIRQLAGQPMIAWTLDAAKKSKYIDRVVVSTDCVEIASTVQEIGAEIPVLRPSSLATDNAKGIDAIIHMLDWLQVNEDYSPDYVMVLQPTSPLRATQDIDAAINCLLKKKGKGVVSVCETEHHPWWSNQLPENACMKDFLRPEVQNSNRQELPAFYQLNGAVYLASQAYLRLMNGFMGEDTYALVMPRERSIDIDTLLDFQFAEILLEQASLK
jgi:CMP-N,N'-diacetyllegionaminic acid synthase